MSLIDHIEKIQKKPDYVRKQITMATTVVFTGVIVLVWLLATNPLSLNNNKDNQGLNQDSVSVLKDIKDTANMAGAAIGGFREGVNQLKDYSDILKQQAEKQSQTEAAQGLETSTSTEATSTDYDNLDLNNYGQN